MKNENSPSAVMFISCPDQMGIVAALTTFIGEHQGNILHLDQHVDFLQNIFFMRVEWDLANFNIPRDQIMNQFQPLFDRFNISATLQFSDHQVKMAIFVSKQSHCLYDLLSRYQAGDLAVDIPLIISNHSTLKPIAHKFGINFYEFNITPENKDEQEKKQIALLREHNIDLIVLARYMQILSESFVRQYHNQIINIHHSFLPAFPGAKPYHSAYARGVKIIGATSHYVTSDLDEGPIIEQDIIRVSHKNSIEDFIRKGKDLEKIVLARAIWYHLQNKILVYHNKTVIFE